MTTNYALYLRRLVFFCYGALLCVYTAGTMIVPPPGKDPNMVVWLVYILPLFLFLPGLLRSNHRTHIWLCFLLLLYFLPSVINAFVPERRFIALLEIGLIVTLFCASMMFARWQQRHAAGFVEKSDES